RALARGTRARYAAWACERQRATPTSARRSSMRRFQHLGLVVRDQRIDHRVELAFDDAIERVQREIDAMVGDPALREVVRSDALRTVAGAVHALAVGGDLAPLRLLGALEEACAQDLQRLRLVLVLRLLVLTGDDEAAGHVRHAYRRVGGVDALPARTRR